MMSFRGERWRQTSIPGSTVWLLTDIAEAKGRQDLYTRQAPQLLDALRRLERQYVERESALTRRLDGLTQQVSALSGQVEALQHLLQRLTRGTG